MIPKKWRSNECISILLESVAFHIFSIIDGKFLKQHCIICGNVIVNEVIKLSKLKSHYHKKHKNSSSKPKNYLKERLLKRLQK